MVEVLFTPAEIATLPQSDLSKTTCVVFDVLRATSCFVTALANGATSVLPVQEISQALAVKADDPDVLLAGERNGLRICERDTGTCGFDLGNSPREFKPEIVRDRKIVSTTTNGTIALRACLGAERVLAGSFLNLSATASYLARSIPPRIVIVGAGTGESMALEDILAAGALCASLSSHKLQLEVTDSVQVATGAYQQMQTRLTEAMAGSRNGRRLCSIPELREDVAFCAQRDIYQTVAVMNSAGALVTA